MAKLDHVMFCIIVKRL